MVSFGFRHFAFHREIWIAQTHNNSQRTYTLACENLEKREVGINVWKITKRTLETFKWTSSSQVEIINPVLRCDKDEQWILPLVRLVSRSSETKTIYNSSQKCLRFCLATPGNESWYSMIFHIVLGIPFQMLRQSNTLYSYLLTKSCSSVKIMNIYFTHFIWKEE